MVVSNIIPGKLYDAREATAVLPFSYNNVLHLIRSGQLPAKKLIIRKTSKNPTPRYYVKGEEIIRFIDLMPSAVGGEENPVKHRTRKQKDVAETEYY